MGDVHAAGNPHYLLDPMQGLKVARYIRDILSTLRPAHKAAFAERYTTFHARLAAALVGKPLAAKYDVEKLVRLADYGKLQAFLHSQGEASLLGGWLGHMQPFRGTHVVADHNQWRYFAQRFTLTISGFMEPKPGLPPTTRHLRKLIQSMRAQQVRLILLGPYFDPRHARFLAQHTDAQIVNMAHQVGARPEAENYMRTIDYNVQQLRQVLSP